MRIPLYQVDAFAGQLFSGNPAAVVFPESELPAELMQSIAAENNLSETAFVVAAGDGYEIRWFTPLVEVNLCGHATLAAAHVIFDHLGYPDSTVSFESRSGGLTVRHDGDSLYLDFPADEIRVVEPIGEVLAGLGAQPAELYRGRDDYLAVFDSEDQIRSIRPDMVRLAEVPARGVIVTAPGAEVDFVSRFFAPQSGIPEDPVTGSAHTTLVPFWSDRFGRSQLVARQLSARGGELRCRHLGERVEIGGRAVTYLVGEIRV